MLEMEEKKKPKVIKLEKKKEEPKVFIPKNDPRKVELSSQERLTEIAMDLSRTIKIGETEHQITALKNGTQWLIAKEAIEIMKKDGGTYKDALIQFADNTPIVAKVITLAILNDKDRIFKNTRTLELSDEYYDMYDNVMWESNKDDWMATIATVLSMISIEVFFYLTESIQIIRTQMTERKMTMEEVKLSQQGQNGV